MPMKENKMTIMPASAGDNLHTADPGAECAVTEKELLTRAGLGRSGCFLYEGVMSSALLGKLSPGPLFRGLKDSVVLPLLFCFGTRPCLLVSIDPSGERDIPTIKKLRKKFFPELAHYNFTFLLSPRALNNFHTNSERREYMQTYITRCPVSCRQSEVFPFDFEEDPFSPFESPGGTEYPADRLYLKNYVNPRLDALRHSLPVIIYPKKESRLAFETIPLRQLTGGLGLEGNCTELLQEKHLTGPDGRPTAFGRQCGLVTRLKLSEDGNTVERELMVVSCAAGALREALCFNRAGASGQSCRLGLKARTERLKNWEVSSPDVRAALLPSLTEDLKKSLNVPLDLIRDIMDRLDWGEYVKLLESLLLPRKDSAFGDLISLAMSRLRSQSSRSGCLDGENGTMQNILSSIAFIIFSSGTADKEARKALSEPGPLEHKLSSLWKFWLPADRMKISHYLLAVAAACDSSYPLWLCQGLGLPEILGDFGCGPNSSISAAVYNAVKKEEDEKINISPFCYTLFVRPLSEIPESFYKAR